MKKITLLAILIATLTLSSCYNGIIRDAYRQKHPLKMVKTITIPANTGYAEKIFGKPDSTFLLERWQMKIRFVERKDHSKIQFYIGDSFEKYFLNFTDSSSLGLEKATGSLQKPSAMTLWHVVDWRVRTDYDIVSKTEEDLLSQTELKNAVAYFLYKLEPTEEKINNKDSIYHLLRDSESEVAISFHAVVNDTPVVVKLQKRYDDSYWSITAVPFNSCAHCWHVDDYVYMTRSY